MRHYSCAWEMPFLRISGNEWFFLGVNVLFDIPRGMVNNMLDNWKRGQQNEISEIS